MELRHLNYFIAVAEELHFGRAAARLHISQPPLSQQIMSLEDELGVRLLERNRRRVALTEAGRLFLDEARAVVARARDAAALARAVGTGEAGRLVVGFVTSAGYSILPYAVRLFRAAHPAVEFHLREMKPSEQLEALPRGDIDVGLLRPLVSCPGIATEKLLDEPLVAALPRDHPGARRKQIPFSALKEEPLILFPRRHGPGLHDVVIRACLDAGFTPEPKYEPDDMQSVLTHVAAGLGVAIVPASLSGFHGDDITYRKLTHPTCGIGLLAARRARQSDLLVDAFIRLCRSAADRWRKQHGSVGGG